LPGERAPLICQESEFAGRRHVRAWGLPLRSSAAFYARAQRASFNGETGEREDSIRQWKCIFEESEVAYRTTSVQLLSHISGHKEIQKSAQQFFTHSGMLQMTKTREAFARCH